MTKINHVHLHQPINSGNRKRISATIVVNKNIFKSTAAISTLTSLCTNDAAINLLTTSVSNSNLSATTTGNILTTTANNLSTPNDSDPTTKLICQWSPKTENYAAKLEIVDGSCQWNSGTGYPQNPNFQDYLSLLVTPEDASPSNQKPTQKQQTLTSNIPLATVTNDESLAAIFPFEIEKPSNTSLFSGATLNKKPITMMYTDVKVDGQSIKLILDSGSAGIDRAASARIITANGATKTPIGEIDDFPFEVNSIMTPIKVLMMEATQYQALVGNNWLFKVNTTLDWNTQELQLTYQGRHICVPATCGHFKAPPREKLLIELEEKKEKPTWEAYQVSWTDANHNELSPILS
ncbi:hypothetical protein G9A89_006167 [Geosiphon pyriformis]|nr:hypothetical protein G9A89_006167 [Geosiphon pyriformis]